jgi:sugar lactone lactonase YvrE
MSRMTPSDDTAMAIDGMGNIVLLNSTHMKVYGRNGDLLRVVGHGGASQGRDRSATFVSAVVDGAGNVVALDQQNCRIVVLSAAGELVRFFASESGEGALWIAMDVEVDGAGSVYVVDWGANRIVVFSAAGVFLRAFGEQGEGKLRHPVRVAVDGAGNVWVADWKLNGARIVVFSAAGEFVRAFAHDYARNMWAMDMAVDGSGNFYLLDVDNHRIGVFSAAGELIGNMGDKQGKGGGIPSRLEVDTAGRRLSAGTLEMSRTLGEGMCDVSPNDIFSRGEIPFPRLVVDSAGSVFVRHFDLDRNGRHQHVTLFEQPIRLNEEYERERTVALLMGSHQRLGTPSKLGLLDPQLLRTIWDTLEHNKDNDTFNESASRVRIIHCYSEASSTAISRELKGRWCVSIAPAAGKIPQTWSTRS